MLHKLFGVLPFGSMNFHIFRTSETQRKWPKPLSRPIFVIRKIKVDFMLKERERNCTEQLLTSSFHSMSHFPTLSHSPLLVPVQWLAQNYYVHRNSCKYMMTHRLLPLPFWPFFQLTQQILMKAHNCALAAAFFWRKTTKIMHQLLSRFCSTKWPITWTPLCILRTTISVWSTTTTAMFDSIVC